MQRRFRLPVRVMTVLAVVVAGACAYAPTPAAGATVLAAAGDIACPPGSTSDAMHCQDSATATLIASASPAAVAALGDNQYDAVDYATLNDYASVFDHSWGTFKSSICPVPGNHEYSMNPSPAVSETLGYFQYFNDTGAVCPPSEIDNGWYSYDLGSWHVIALNSNCGAASCLNSNQGQVPPSEIAWLKNDLASHPGVCTIAYWHHPLFTDSTVPAPSPATQPLWDALYAARADIVLNGHAHVYERFPNMDPSGTAKAEGIREFVVGTGGDDLGNFGASDNSDYRQNTDFGALFLTLGDGTYGWSFRSIAGAQMDPPSGVSRTASCHSRTTPATNTTRSAATLHGLFNPAGNTAYVYRFEWGTTTSYDQETDWTTVPAGHVDEPLSAALSGLAPGTTYHYRVVVTDDTDDPARIQTGRDSSLTTPEDAAAPSPQPPAQAPAPTSTSIDSSPIAPGFPEISPVSPGVPATSPIASGFPAISDLRVKPRSVAVASAASDSPRGATVAYVLTDTAVVTFRLERAAPGIRRGSACVRALGPRSGRRCTRWSILSALTVRQHAGFRRWHLSRLVSGRRLRPGFYRIAALPRDVAGHLGVPNTARFRIVA